MSAASVLYTAPIGELGGVERFLDAVLPHHDPARVRPVLLAFEEGPFPAALRERGIATHVIAGARMHDIVDVTRRVRRVIRDERVQLVHSAFSWAHAMTAPAAWLTGTPQLWFHHGPIWPQFWQAWTSMVPARAVLTNSAYNLGRLRRTAHLTREHRVFHLCVDPDRFAPDAARRAAFRARLGVADATPLIGIVGFIDDTKGQDVFLHAAQLHVGRGLPGTFVIVGGPRAGAAGERGDRMLRELHAFVDERGLRDRVIFTGHLDVMDGALDALDVAVQASTAPEAFGMVVLEAMAKQKASIATAEGGPLEFVTHEVDGLLVPPRDPALLAEAMGRLVADRDLALRLAEAGRRTVVERFHPRTVARRLEDYYATLLPRRAARARLLHAATT